LNNGRAAGDGGALPEHSAGRDDRRVAPATAIKVRDLVVGFGDKLVMQGLDLDVYRGEVLGFVGGSGTGKSVLTRTILRLVRKRSGLVEIFGVDVDSLSPREYAAIERRIGVMFQQGALFSGLTVKQNVEMPMREHLRLSPRLSEELAMLKIELTGLDLDAANKYPSELSGGMTKRAALARALALDPELVFLDEPTSGLDPIGAAEFDELIATLQRTLGLTVFMVTHDLDSLYSICDRIAALADGKVVAEGPVSTMLASRHPWVHAYFHGKRARLAGSALTGRSSTRGMMPENEAAGLPGQT
jgi:phospholipid/cholesterol/gamma-HCH transport system ATP-binding protein